MRRSPSPRASWPFAAASLVLAATVALGADASGATATSEQPGATSPRQAQVEAVTVSEAGGGEPGGAVGGMFARGDDTADAYGWRSGLFPLRVEVTAPVATVTKPKAVSPTQPAAPRLWWKRYQGVNHVWMPTLGISKHVYLYACSRSRDPENLVYRWGCAGSNNVYLLGHAYGVFRALHDAYYNGKLRKGMPVVYANGSGKERLYRVVSWRVVSPLDSGWAIASQPVPSMTLQTCIGPNDSLRLNVRLVVAER